MTPVAMSMLWTRGLTEAKKLAAELIFVLDIWLPLREAYAHRLFHSDHIGKLVP